MHTNGASTGGAWQELADELWLSETPVRPTPGMIKSRIWDPLEADGFQPRSLAQLESLQILERFLWPAYTDDASNHVVLLIAFFVTFKQRAHVPIWDIFLDDPDKFHSLFHRVLSLSLDVTLSSNSSSALLCFVIAAFQSLEKQTIRKECAPLVSVSIWQHFHSDGVREKLLETNTSARKAWRAAHKRYEAADKAAQAKMRFDRSWLYTLLLDFLRRINDADGLVENVNYCQRFLELIIDLLSQLPTRRYTNTLVRNLNLLALIRLSPMYADERSSLIRDQCNLLHQFVDLAIDEQGEALGPKASYDAHCQALSGMQRVAMKYFESKLKVLALSNYGSISQRSDLGSHFSELSDSELTEFSTKLNVRTTYPESTKIAPNRRLLLESLLCAYAAPINFEKLVSELPVLPTEKDLYDPALLQTEQYDGSDPLAISKLNLQYLNLADFLWRSSQLFRSEAFFAIRSDVESVVRRMKPRAGTERGSIDFGGFSKMALPISKPAIVEVAQSLVGSDRPAFVRAELIVDINRLRDNLRMEWDSLRPGDVVFLVGLKSNPTTLEVDIGPIRGAEIYQVLDGNGRSLRETQEKTNGFVSKSPQRRLLVNLDTRAYKADQERVKNGRPDVYPLFNVVVRRNKRENNFKAVLSTIQSLASSETNIPSWFRDSFLGFGDPRSSHHTQLDNKIESVDFRDTFLDWNHLLESFPSRKIESSQAKLSPPYRLQNVHDTQPSNPKKRRRDQMEEPETAVTPLSVTSYSPPNTGPYPMDVPRTNTIRFTPAQTEAIASGTQPGLSVIVGPPGTGKTDVATQIINLLYHNFPKERILLVAHSNQALNQLFQKIISLDIDGRHLLRLGHGEEDLETEASYSKSGRVESFMENRSFFLAEVDRLAASIGAKGAHGSTCETADYFSQVFIRPAWSRFWDQTTTEASSEAICQAFPFHDYFSNAPEPPISPQKSVLANIEAAKGCDHHISRIFTELESIRPFEILRQSRHQENYLLIKEARIIAMTSTHAAIRRFEIAELGFHYDTLIMEEAAQITEIESFIPCAMQLPHPKTKAVPLKRIVLVGDHLQNSPVVQNLAFRQYANLEQSLFLRLIRLGVPTITLDQQGRCRPSLAKLFSWRYPSLTNLPHLTSSRQFRLANPGFKHDYQFLNIPTYQSQDEREPTPHFLQNLGEAEYAVALYQYMRLLGYPANSITILTTYAGQRALIKDVLGHRCQGNTLFGMPKHVATVDKYQGEQNDYVILSLVRTKAVGYLRDVRRVTVALSRARLGLYVLGRGELWDNCTSISPAMGLFRQRPEKLVVVPNEVFPPGGRNCADEVEGVEIEGVEHLGKYVYQMTQAKVKAMGGRIEIAGGMEVEGKDGPGVAEVPDLEAEEDIHQDPLHEHVTV